MHIWKHSEVLCRPSNVAQLVQFHAQQYYYDVSLIQCTYPTKMATAITADTKMSLSPRVYVIVVICTMNVMIMIILNYTYK